MGGTLDNGIYLPDQGERNCYNGLKNNWDTLDNLIETVQALSSAGLTREIVNSLPTENIKTNVIYMLRNSQQSGDLYDEYMYINNAWEPIGTSATEMDNYYTKSETNALPAVASGITASKVTGYDSHVANTEVHITAAERSTWNGKQNALDPAQTAAVNSGVNATKVTEYDTHVADTVVHVTASDKTAWNAKQDGLSQAQLNAVNSGVTSAKVTGYDTHVGDTSAHVSSSDRTAWNGKQDALSQTQLDNIAAVPDKANSADLATVATTGDYGDLLNAPTIPTVNNATLTIQKNGTDVATFTANASSNVTANLSIPTDTSDLTNGAGFLTQHNPIDNELSVSSENAVQNKVVTTALNGKAASSHTHAAGDINTGTFNIARIPDLDASKITSGTIDIARLPKGSLERLIKVADQTARFALTTDDVQLGDTVQQLDTGVMYVVTDETKLDSADGYTEFTAGSATSVPWSGVTGKPSTFTPSSHSHGNISNDGKVGTTANLPLITGTGGAITAGVFGTSANTFCEGNDSRLSDARTPVAHTHTKSDVTNLLNSDFIPSANNSYDLGSSSYQWNNLYAKNYFYNGVAWGLDKTNFWTNSNYFTLSLYQKGFSARAQTPASSEFGSFGIVDVNNVPVISFNYANRNTGARDISIRVCDNAGTANGAGVFKDSNDKYSFCSIDPNNTIELGTSTNKWKSIYSDSYYYGTTAWGLDKANEWTGDNTFSSATNSVFCFKFGTSGSYSDIRWKDNNDSHYATLRGRVNELTLGLKYSSASAWYNGASVNINNNGNVQIKAYDGTESWTVNFTPIGVYPTSDKALELGTSTNKWKTLNGVNPGALSLPDCQVTQSIDRTGWVYDGATYNTVLLATTDTNMTKNGWLYVRMANTTSSDKLTIKYNSTADRYPCNTFGDVGGYIEVFVPVVANTNIYLLATKDLSFCKFYPCLGNVPSGV